MHCTLAKARKESLAATPTATEELERHDEFYYMMASQTGTQARGKWQQSRPERSSWRPLFP